MATDALLLTLLCLFGVLEAAHTPPAPEPVAADGPSPAVNCLRRMLNVSDCLSYVQIGSNETKPDGACCPELAGMIDSSPECVCNLLGGGASARFAIKLDKQRATELPSLCGVAPPSSSLCSVLGFPANSPTGSEGSSASDSQAEEGENSNGGPTIGIWAGGFIRMLLLVGILFLF